MVVSEPMLGSACRCRADRKAERERLLLLDGEVARLHPELRLFIVEGDGVSIDHPLLEFDDVKPEQVREINAKFSALRRQCSDAYNADDWQRYLALFRSDFRLTALAGVESRIKSDDQFGGLFEFAWRSSACTSDPRLRRLFKRIEKMRLPSMLDTARAAWSAVSVGQGDESRDLIGWRWSLSEADATRQAESLFTPGRTAVILETSVQPGDVAYLFEDLDEIAVDPKCIENINSRLCLTQEQQDWLQWEDQENGDYED